MRLPFYLRFTFRPGFGAQDPSAWDSRGLSRMLHLPLQSEVIYGSRNRPARTALVRLGKRMGIPAALAKNRTVLNRGRGACPSGGLYVIMFWAGIALIAIGVLYACMGRAYASFRGWVYRADKPKGYWLVIASYVVTGAALIAYALYENSFSN